MYRPTATAPTCSRASSAGAAAAGAIVAADAAAWTSSVSGRVQSVGRVASAWVARAAPHGATVLPVVL
ncbi:MAG TPA: hypothetical protein VGM74_17135 [Burkholderiaceae bacterium]|jgi:hypothetical protein